MDRRLSHCTLRRFRPEDAESFARHANDRAIWQNLRDRFPHPYSLEHAKTFIATVGSADPPTVLGIEVDGEMAGVVGFELGSDVERVSAELGYWLGQRFWGRGVISEVVAAATPWAIETFALERVFALPFAHNVASQRVLEKAGFVKEGVLRRCAVKDGMVLDQILYAFVPGAGDRIPTPDPAISAGA